MAKSQIVDSYRTVQVLSQNTVQDIQYITARTVPTGLTFAYPMALSTWQSGPPYLVIDEISGLLENLVTYNNVVAGSAVQDVDANSLLVDYVDLVVQYDQTAAGLPALQGTVSIGISILSLWATDPGIADQTGLPTPEQLVGAEYARLQSLASG